MANKQLINGKVYDWSSVTITASGMENMEPMEISYDDEQESEPIYGRGGKIRGYGTGNQKNSVKLSLLREDFNEMCRVIQSKTDILQPSDDMVLEQDKVIMAGDINVTVRNVVQSARGKE